MNEHDPAAPARTTSPKPFVFVLMPFADEFADLYELAIKPACAEAGAYCERVDEQVFDGSIFERILNQIAKADVIVAEMTGRNANVFYETGYAHALGQRVILLTKTVDDIPFDLKHFPHLVHGLKLRELKPQLQARLEWCFANPKGSLARAAGGLRVLVNGVDVEASPKIPAPFDFEMWGGSFPLRVSVFNDGTQALDSRAFRLGIISDEPQAVVRLMDDTTADAADLGGERRMHMLPALESLLPGAADVVEIYFAKERGWSPTPESLKLVLRVFREVGFADHPIELRAKP